MEFEVKMPDISTTESQAKILNWLVAPGDAVKRGQALLEVETDKATMEVECSVNGVVKRVVVPADQIASVGDVIAIVETE